MTHTKGPWIRMPAEPWTVDNDDSYGHSYTGIGVEKEHPIALVVAADYQSNECFNANAALIAAAPELLEACVEFVRRVEAGEIRSKLTYATMKAVIAKAKGEQS